ncbi:GDSL-type esterase/lipase family protein [Hymenobacter psychrotolerans]|uniref:Lysophospholipase L1 n=1 Tax=Hymenobacter psychrotolerans DSM 18569 TaxID=1121959 RepID=A0A1M7EPZ1_9BACT|nr:GDSL-type esterase/lipase family protein [Hymenobacter psychrotolerans]SHL93653.1 Lysophospholipase L1 [Hymenobacter psychrotolerans DSM 18569]
MMAPLPCYLLLGDSLTAGFDVTRLLPELAIRNEGVSGDSTVELLERLRPDWLLTPGLRAVFVCIGTNDLARDRTDHFILQQITRLVAALRPAAGPARPIYLTSLFPTRDNEPRPNPRIVGFNRQLALLATQLGTRFLNLHPHFADAAGQLYACYTEDGLHLTEAAYAQWARLLQATIDADFRT